MKQLKIILGAGLLALSGASSVNIAQAGNHTADRYMAPYSSHGNRKPVCKPGYKVSWYKRVAYCEKKNLKKKYGQQMHRMQQQGYKPQTHKGKGFIIWDMKNGRKVARCKPGYKLNHKFGKYSCVRYPKGNANNKFLLENSGIRKQQQAGRVYRKDKKYDQYLRWQGYKAVCTKGKFWVEGHNKNIVHCSSK